MEVSKYHSNFPRKEYLLGGLGLHFDNFIAWCMAISFQQFGTLPFGIILLNLGKRHHKTYPRIRYDYFELCQFMMTPGLFKYFKKDPFRQRYLNSSVTIP